MNPSGGTIQADYIGELIVEKDKIDPDKIKSACGNKKSLEESHENIPSGSMGDETENSSEETGDGQRKHLPMHWKKVLWKCLSRQENRREDDGNEYQIDFTDLEENLSDPQTTLLILCNPHNPVGKIWDRETLKRIGDLCRQYHVLVLSDEIHCDLTAPGCEYTPFASVSENCRRNSITCVAPTKAFNLAGIQTASVIVPDEHLRHKVNRGLNTDEAAEPNVFAAIAPVAAFTCGGEWLDTLREYLWENRRFAEKFIDREIKAVSPVSANATYLL